jgi:hypothetical protein
LNKARILIIGYQRSGTTLLRRLVEKHPDVYCVFHETWLLTGDKFTREGWRKKFGKVASRADIVWGEKIAYTGTLLEKMFENPSIVFYVREWEEIYKDSSRIVHIFRHPLDVAVSNTELKWTKSYHTCINAYLKSVPKVIRKIKSCNIKYEDLVYSTTDVLKTVFDYCGLNSDDSLVKEIATGKLKNLQKIKNSTIRDDRIFIYKNKIFKKEKMGDHRKCLDLLNRFGRTKYNWIP